MKYCDKRNKKKKKREDWEKEIKRMMVKKGD